MGDDTKDLFKNILSAFLAKYQFALPDLLAEQPQPPVAQPEMPVEFNEPMDQA